MVMVCKIKGSQFREWNRLLLASSAAHRAAGLTLLNMWRTQEDPESVFFIFSVRDMETVRSYIDEPHNAEALGLPGLPDGEYHFVENTDGY